MPQVSNIALDRIPLDIVRLVVNSLDTSTDKATLQNLRLTCQLLNDLATPQLFHTLTIGELGRLHTHPRYLHHVRWLLVDRWTWNLSVIMGRPLTRPNCPFRFLDLLTQMPRLERLLLRGTYNCSGDDIGVSDDEDFNQEQKALEMADLFKQMSFLTPTRQRVKTNLQFLYLDLDIMRKYEDWHLATFAAVFLIPSLRVLIARGQGLSISSDGPPLPMEHIGVSGLRELKLANARIEMPFLESLLMLPAALEELSLRGQTIVLPDGDEDIDAVRKFQRAAERQSVSLRVLELNEGLHTVDEIVLGGVLDLSRFVALRRYEGYYEDVSKRF
ncbi:hypothetical protein P168DRAFT_320280 [Aspergillus campestris IBT 28561]|uniref:F-box domain-containing protein n=1 Tax=Aspergillus campestris (strain IBT 28561) TaxID=1392248 RepID=A0A2I1CYP6_ASPC2|nr:uncharacterized protein P168DRAFT_320280 [Aspergillus campestris IBT 28561]PKY02735.1 hypothetical protein P168DRAFT_320280 [Aspergillus campestris IBT 28561]